MSQLFVGVAACLIVNAGVGLVRVVRGPSPLDRVLAVQIMGTTGVAVLLLLAEAGGASSLRDVALIFVLLAAVVSVAFVEGETVRASNDEPEGV